MHYIINILNSLLSYAFTPYSEKNLAKAVAILYSHASPPFPSTADFLL